MCHSGVGLLFDAFEVQIQPNRLAGRTDARINFSSPFRSAKFVFQVLLARDACLRQIGVELKRMPTDLNRWQVGGLWQFQRRFEFAFADKAPGANHIRDDVDGQRRRAGIGSSRGQVRSLVHINPVQRILGSMRWR